MIMMTVYNTGECSIVYRTMTHMEKIAFMTPQRVYAAWCTRLEQYMPHIVPKSPILRELKILSDIINNDVEFQQDYCKIGPAIYR